MKKIILAAALPLILLAGCASIAPIATPATMKNGMLVDSRSMTLYTFDRDVANSGKSACNADCAVKWPPMLANANDKPVGDYTLLKREDGRMQWAYRGKPLYTWPEDQEPGEKFGDNYNKVWHIVQ